MRHRPRADGQGRVLDLLITYHHGAAVAGDRHDAVVGAGPARRGVHEHVDVLVDDGVGRRQLEEEALDVGLSEALHDAYQCYIAWAWQVRDDARARRNKPDRKHCCSESKARPLSSEAIRSGRSSMTFLRRMCLSELCQAGTKWSMCLQSVALPSSLHLVQASSTLNVLKMGSCEK